MKPSLDIVIVNWNAGELLRACLASIHDALDENFRLERVVVVDNASTDGSARGHDDLGLSLSVIENAENRGFGSACNQGAAGSAADYVLFLNPDTRLFGDSLARPLEFLERGDSAGVGICGIQLVDEAGQVAKSCARFPGPATFLWIAIGLDKLFPRAELGYRMTEFDHRETRAVDHVMGAFFLVRRHLFERLAGFDEDYFMYFEDVDFSKRAADLGLESRFLADARAFHVGGGTSRRVKARRLAYFLRSKLLYARKHHPGWRARLAAASTLVVEPVFRCAGALLSLSPGDFASTLGAYRMLYGSAADG